MRFRPSFRTRLALFTTPSIRVVCHGSTRRLFLACDEQLALRHGDRSAAQEGPIVRYAHFDDAAAGRGLEGGEFGFAEPLSPVVAQATVGGAGHRVFVDTGRGGEEPGDEIEARIGRGAGD